MYERLNKCELVKSEISLNKIVLVFYIEDTLENGIGECRVKFVYEPEDINLLESNFKSYEDLVDYIHEYDSEIDVISAISVYDLEENDIFDTDEILYQLCSVKNTEGDDLYEDFFDINPPIIESPMFFELLVDILNNPSFY